MNKYRKLIEVALPIREISAESVRDKSLRHGNRTHMLWNDGLNFRSATSCG